MKEHNITHVLNYPSMCQYSAGLSCYIPDAARDFIGFTCGATKQILKVQRKNLDRLFPKSFPFNIIMCCGVIMFTLTN